jgi:RND family efflux transporter MFP subunit
MNKIILLIIVAFPLIIAGCLRQDQNSETAVISTNEIENPLHENETEGEIAGIELTRIEKKPFKSVVKSGGIIITDSKDLIVVTSKSSGIVKLSSHFLFPGVKTSKGQLLFTISGDDLAEDNTELKLLQVKADLEKANANYERAQRLLPDKIITEEQFLSTKNEYFKALNEYNVLSRSYSQGGNTVSSPENGYLRDIFVIEGQKVKAGDQLATIVIMHNLVLKTFVSPENIGMLSSIEKANFTVGYSNKLYKTDELNGRNISFGKSTGENSYYIPVYFNMDYVPDLIEGTFAEVYLIGKVIPGAIVVPNSALMEEYGKFYVFVRHEDGDFLKRYIKTGFDDGENTQILEGLAENEVIVSSGAYQVKLSLMSNSAPAHSHNH